MRGIIPGLMVSLSLSLPVVASNPITNYKSGISIGFSGQDGIAYAFECWYHDPLIDDHGVVYIKAATQISLQHNARNIAYVDDTQRETFVGSDVGVIRYKVDRDQQNKYGWASGYPYGALYPAYTQPFSFSDLHYGPDDPAVPVVGSTGPKPGVVITDRTRYYCRGLLDACGDEWHILTVGDDDNAVNSSITDGRHKASDGKIHYFIVNPKTPAIFFTPAAAGAQFYTTPVKSYFIPRLHEQTTYVTDNININLVNIMSGNPVYYRFDNGSFQPYNGPITTNTLSDGEHTLEYYYQDSFHRTRRVVKNPGYPSDNDVFAHDGNGHGYLLWKNEAEFTRIKANLTGASTSALQTTQQSNYTLFCNNTSGYVNSQDPFDALEGKGLRVTAQENWCSYACLMNAFIAVMQGLNTKYPSYARRMLLENEFVLDPIGYEYDPSRYAALPGMEQLNCGYYNARAFMSLAFAYDLLITGYRKPAYANGFTAIEDLKIRDVFANYVITALLWRAGYVWTHQEIGMWGSARQVGALVAALAMPAYNTTYYGTSGFDGSPATVAGVPFPDQAVTWKQLFYDDDVPWMRYPNQQQYVGLKNRCAAFYNQDGTLVSCWSWPAPGMIDTADGTSFSAAYTSYNLMGNVIGIYPNVMRIKFDRYERYLDKFFYRCNNGTQPVSHGLTVGYYPNLLCINQYFPDSVAQAALDKTASDWQDTPIRDIYKVILVNPDWKNTNPVTGDTRPAPSAPGRALFSNPFDGVLCFPSRVCQGVLQITLYDGYGRHLMTRRFRNTGEDQALDVRSLCAGIYFYTAASPGYAGSGKLVKIGSE